MNSPGCTRPPLYLAVEKRDSRLVALLIDYGASPNARFEHNDTSIMLAAKRACPEILQFLLDHGASARAEDRCGCTPLHHLASSFDDCTVENLSKCAGILVEHKANPNAINFYDKTPLAIAIDRKRPQLIEVLLQNGATETVGKSAFEIARDKKGAIGEAILSHFARVRLRSLRGVVRFLIMCQRYREDFYRHKYVAIGEQSFTLGKRKLRMNDSYASAGRQHDRAQANENKRPKQRYNKPSTENP